MILCMWVGVGLRGRLAQQAANVTGGLFVSVNVGLAILPQESTYTSHAAVGFCGTGQKK